MKNKFLSLSSQLAIAACSLVTVSCVSDDFADEFIEDDHNDSVQVLPSIPLPFIGEEVQPKETPEAVEQIKTTDDFFSNNAIYQKIAVAVANRGTLSSELDLQGSHYNVEAFRRTLLPQLTPQINTNQNGDVLGRLIVEQVIYDSGRFRAGKRVLSAEQAVAFAEHVIQFNERVSSAVDAYLRSNQARELSQISASLSQRYENMLAQARQRLSGGVGKKSELSLFDIKRLENVNESASDKAIADAAMVELETLTGRRFEESPQRINLPNETRQPPSISLAVAQRKIAGAQLRVEQANRLPELRLVGSVGEGTSFGSGFDDQANTLSAGVRLNQPLTWGKDYQLRSSKAELRASHARVLEQERDINAELNRLQLQARAFEIQLIQSENFLNATRERADEFEQQFLGGAVSIVEAVSILDAYKRAARMNVEMKYSLIDAERQIAQIKGLFGPFAN